MFITLKRHGEIVRTLKEELRGARDLKVVLEMIAEKTGFPTAPKEKGKYTLGVDTGFASNFSFAWCDATASLPDNVAQYVPDHFGGKVIKQEATKVVVLGADGSVVANGYTKRKADKGYSYLLVRQ